MAVVGPELSKEGRRGGQRGWGIGRRGSSAMALVFWLWLAGRASISVHQP